LRGKSFATADGTRRRKRKRDDHADDDRTLHAKRQVACVTQERHLKDLEAVDKRNPVDPLCQTPVIPHFPEETADQARKGGAENERPVPLRQGFEEMILLEEGLKRDQDEQRGYPEKGEEMMGEQTEEKETCSCGSEYKASQASRPGDTERREPLKAFHNPGEREEPFPGGGKSGQDRRKRKGSIKKVFGGTKLRPYVIPVLDETIQVLKEPPEGCTHRKKEQKGERLIQHQTTPGPAVGQGIQSDDIANP
jgi:hypothetical protein